MKNAISNIWLLGLIITFILLFSAYIAITVNYSKSFRLKNEVLDIIEKHRGMSNYTGKTVAVKLNGTVYNLKGGAGTLQTINLYLGGNSYSATGKCNPNEYDYGVNELNYRTTVTAQKLNASTRNNKYYYCFSKHPAGVPGPYDNVYYRVRLFYKFEIPVLADFFSVKVEGITNEIYKPVDDGFVSNNSFNYVG